MTAGHTYARLVELIDGDDELIAALVEAEVDGVIVRGSGDLATVDVDRVLLVRTLVRELEVDWPGVEVILRLRDELVAARARIAELEAAVAAAALRAGR